MTIVIRTNHHQSVERNASARPDSSAIYWRWQYVHGGRLSHVSALVTVRNTGDDTGLDRSNSFGAFKALRSLLTPLVQAGKQSPSGLANRLEILSCALLHALRKAWRLTRDVQRKSAFGAERHE